MHRHRRSFLGTAAAVGLVVALSLVMVPLRDHLSVASSGLVLVVPVVAGVAIGGLVPGIVAVAAGFIAYDLVFIPPYGTLAVGAVQNWVALVVYVVVLGLVAAVVADQRRARAEARHREHEARRLAELAETLSADAPDLPDRIVQTVARAFHPRWVALLVPRGDGLEVAATAGTGVAMDEITAVAGQAGVPVHLLDDPGGPSGPSDSHQPVAVALVTGDTPSGLLAVAPAPADRRDRRLLAAFANHAALAVERARLRDQAVRAEVLEAQEQAHRTLLRTVSHDLRTPLATVKASISEVRASADVLTRAERDELLALAEAQADRLDRLVANLLDINRIEAGTLVVQHDAVPVAELVRDVVASLGDRRVSVHVPSDVPAADADHTLVGQVLANLLDNALRHSSGPVAVHAERRGGQVLLTVSDRGPGIVPGGPLDALRAGTSPPAAPPRPATAASAAPGGPSRPAGGPSAGRGGLGLTIAQAFVAAHGSSLVVDDNPGGGARFSFALPVAALDELDEPDPGPPPRLPAAAASTAGTARPSSTAGTARPSSTTGTARPSSTGPA